MALLGAATGLRQPAGSRSAERYFFAADDSQRIARCTLLGFLLVGSPGRRILRAADLGGHFEAFAVVGAFFVEQLIGGGGLEFPLGQLLEQRLVVATLSNGRTTQPCNSCIIQELFRNCDRITIFSEPRGLSVESCTTKVLTQPQSASTFVSYGVEIALYTV